MLDGQRGSRNSNDNVCLYHSLSMRNGGGDETRTRDLCRDSERFISTCNDLQEHGRHPKSLQDSLRHRYCVPRCVPRFPGSLAKLIDWLRGGCNAPKLPSWPCLFATPSPTPWPHERSRPTNKEFSRFPNFRCGFDSHRPLHNSR